MTWWDNLRTAYTLAARIEECESRIMAMESDWTDIQDKLLAREERLRKRLSRELKASLGESPPPDPSQPSDRASTRTPDAKLQILRTWREQQSQLSRQRSQ